ncbi:MAG: methyl-accepting chemotaxis protein [Rhodopseudomonas sp.]|uniref:methyl-accepting chemotaxis protein n=1 Tax=Rhodopseudomonas sp. TaxID=1078 RepID=UPI00183CFCAA|nr:methyl-accepting chemotaxis protein [Rhodopseudomonas sp.]NVN87943.1 methyl-accepting chemotaxis protein [Rhodopseudomonas sp.]
MKLNRIGNKLGLVGLVGVALAIGGLVNQRLSEASIESVNQRKDAQQSISEQALVVAIGFRRVQLAAKDIRYAKSAAEIEKSLAEIPASKTMYENALDMATGLAVQPDNKARFVKIKSLTADYIVAVDEVARLGTAKFALLATSNAQSKAWTEKFDVLLASPALAQNPNQLAVERDLQEADANLNAAAGASWRFAATGEPAMKTQIAGSAAKVADMLTRAGTLANDVTIRRDIEALAGVAKTFIATTNELVKNEEATAAVTQTRALPAAAGGAEFVTAALGAAKKFLTEAKEQAEQETLQANRVNLWLSIVVVLSIVGSVLFAFLGVARPMTRLNNAMATIAAGEPDVAIPGAARGDEVGDMARTVTVNGANAAQKARNEVEAKTKQDLVAADRRKSEMTKLADDFEGAVGRIVQTVSSASGELEASAGTLTATAERSQQLTNMVAAASEEASSNVQSVASATEEMSSSVNEISRQVQESARIAGAAVQQAQKTNDRVGELAQAASRIGAVVELINTIAGQTNLLALNATIEAARAGEAGRGFAVVASEVKALAEQTAKATGEISQQISGIQSATQDSVAAIKEIGSTIGQMSEIASTIASAVEQQGAATQEISRNVQRAAQGTMQVSTNIADVQRGVGEAGLASSQVLSAAQSLSGESNRLKLEVGKFLNSVRAA